MGGGLTWAYPVLQVAGLLFHSSSSIVGLLTNLVLLSKTINVLDFFTFGSRLFTSINYFGCVWPDKGQFYLLLGELDSIGSFTYAMKKLR